MWSIVQVYAPTDSSKPEDITRSEFFYENLQSVLQTCHKNLIIMGDFNAKVGTAAIASLV